MFKEHSSMVKSVAFSQDSKLTVSRFNDNTLRLWNAASGTLLHVVKRCFSSANFVVQSLNCARATSRCVVPTTVNPVICYTLDDGQWICSLIHKQPLLY